MVANTPSRSALLFAHVFEKYVDFVEEGNYLGPQLPNVFPDFRNRRILRTRMQNACGMAAKSPHVFEKYGKCATKMHVLCARVRERSQVRRRPCSRKEPSSPPGGPPGGPPDITYSSMKSDGFEYDTSVSTFVCTRARGIRRFC